MGDKVEPSEAGKKSGWLKAIIGSAAGVLSGAVMMYLSPLIDKVIKPSKPVANFAIDYQDLTVTFHNRSMGGNQGWWDFGDGSPLEPLDPKQEIVPHTYPMPGTYTAKLSVRNLLGDESERTVQVNVAQQKMEAPQILTLQAESISNGAFAPATFKVSSTAKGADLAVWNLGEDKPLEFNSDTPNKQERLVTFNKPGGYVVKLAVVNGKQAVEKSEVVWVNEPPNDTCAIVLHCADSATKIETLEVPMMVSEAFPAKSKDSIHKIDRQLPARPGFEITGARVQPVTDAGARNLRILVSPDKRTAQLLGELPMPSAAVRGKAAPGAQVVRVLLTQERRVAVSRPPVAMSTTISVPGNAILSLPPLPDGWTEAQRQVRVELRDGDRTIWQESQLPHGIPVQIQGRRCSLSATQFGSSQVKVDLVEIRGQTPAAN